MRSPTAHRSCPFLLGSLFLLLATACAEPDEPLGTGAIATGAMANAHASSGTPSPSRELSRQLAALRRVTAPYHHLENASRAGYTEQVTPCWEHRSLGAMGYHMGNPAYIDGTVNLLEPELLMYEPQAHGPMKLVGMEYIVPIAEWSGDSPPTLLGQVMHQHSALPIYKLHIWLWETNSRGIFADWNPAVSCTHAEVTETFE